MFAPRKLVLVDPADPLLKAGGDEAPPTKGRRAALSNREIMENYIEAPSDSAVLVKLVRDSCPKPTRLHKNIGQAGGHPLVRGADQAARCRRRAWLTKRARDMYGKGIEPMAAARLADLIGPDLARLDNELAKLSLYDPGAVRPSPSKRWMIWSAFSTSRKFGS